MARRGRRSRDQGRIRVDKRQLPGSNIGRMLWNMIEYVDLNNTVLLGFHNCVALKTQLGNLSSNDVGARIT